MLMAEHLLQPPAPPPGPVRLLGFSVSSLTEKRAGDRAGQMQLDIRT